MLSVHLLLHHTIAAGFYISNCNAQTPIKNNSCRQSPEQNKFAVQEHLDEHVQCTSWPSTAAGGRKKISLLVIQQLLKANQETWLMFQTDVNLPGNTVYPKLHFADDVKCTHQTSVLMSQH